MENLQFITQTYFGFGQHVDGSSWQCRGRRLSDGTWFEIRWWWPA